MLVNLLSRIERQPILDVAVKEIAAINAPRIAITRSRNERLDVAVNELGDTFGLLGLGFLTDKGLGHLFKKHAGSLNPHTRTWQELGSSFALYSVIFAIMWAMPYVRNYVTAKRMGSTNFAEIIGKGPTDQQPSTQPLQVGKDLSGYKRTILKILALGGLGAGLSVAGSLAAIRRGIKAGRWIHWIHKNIGLEKGSFMNFSEIPAVLFWALPAYAAWIQAARDKYEKKEWMLKFANFVICFMGPQKLLKLWFRKSFYPYLGKEMKPTFANIQKHLSGKLLQKALRLKVWQEGLGLLSSLLLMGISPGLINIALTRKRMARDQAEPSPAINPRQEQRFQAFVLQAQSRYNAIAAPQ